MTQALINLRIQAGLLGGTNEKSVHMEVKDLKWYSPFVFFVGAILSFADSITDIFTLVEFYRADHKRWFGVGLTFVLLPCLALLILFRRVRAKEGWAKTALCAFHPFSAAFGRMELVIFCLKKWWYRDELDSGLSERAEHVLDHIDLAVLFEAALESAPQFIIQLYAINVQKEPAAIIQIVSLPISFLILAWAFTTTDKISLFWVHIIPRSSDLNVKYQLGLYVTHLLLLSSRLFAICYFTVGYKWVVIAVLMPHSCLVLVVNIILQREAYICNVQQAISFLLRIGIYYLRDECLDVIDRTSSIFLSHILFTIENYIMILAFYLNHHPKAWYSLPVTVYVCVVSVLGSTMRILLLRWLCRRRQ